MHTEKTISKAICRPLTSHLTPHQANDHSRLPTSQMYGVKGLANLNKRGPNSQNNPCCNNIYIDDQKFPIEQEAFSLIPGHKSQDSLSEPVPTQYHSSHTTSITRYISNNLTEILLTTLPFLFACAQCLTVVGAGHGPGVLVLVADEELDVSGTHGAPMEAHSLLGVVRRVEGNVSLAGGAPVAAARKADTVLEGLEVLEEL